EQNVLSVLARGSNEAARYRAGRRPLLVVDLELVADDGALHVAVHADHVVEHRLQAVEDHVQRHAAQLEQVAQAAGVEGDAGEHAGNAADARANVARGGNLQAIAIQPGERTGEHQRQVDVPVRAAIERRNQVGRIDLVVEQVVEREARVGPEAHGRADVDHAVVDLQPGRPEADVDVERNERAAAIPAAIDGEVGGDPGRVDVEIAVAVDAEHESEVEPALQVQLGRRLRRDAQAERGRVDAAESEVGWIEVEQRIERRQRYRRRVGDRIRARREVDVGEVGDGLVG